jgi:hypothetical protein
VNAPAHPVDVKLRAVAGNPLPSAIDRSVAARALATAIASSAAVDGPVGAPVREASHRVAWARRGSFARVAFALGAVVLIAVVAVIGLLRPQPVTALGELAAIAERTASPVVASGEFLYETVQQTAFTSLPAEATGSDLGEVAYHEHTMVETWTASDGAVRRTITYETPSFFDTAATAAFEAGRLDAVPAPGTVVTEDLAPMPGILEERPWPEAPDDLLEVMRVFITNEGQDLSEEGAVLELAADLLRAPGASPELRGAVIAALDRMDVEVVERDGSQVVTVSVDYGAPGDRQRLTLEFDAGANMIRETLVAVDFAAIAGVPEGTAIEDSVYSVPMVVDSVERP